MQSSVIAGPVIPSFRRKLHSSGAVSSASGRSLLIAKTKIYKRALFGGRGAIALIFAPNVISYCVLLQCDDVLSERLPAAGGRQGSAPSRSPRRQARDHRGCPESGPSAGSTPRRCKRRDPSGRHPK